MHGSSRKLIVVAFVLLVVAVLLYWKFHTSHHVADEAYVAEPTVNVWSTTAQVRASSPPKFTGAKKVEILGHSDTSTKIRTTKGVTWMG